MEKLGWHVRVSDYKAIEVDVVSKVMPDGSRQIAAFMSARIECRSRVTGDATVLRADGSPVEPPQADPVIALNRAAARYPAIAEALRFFRKGDWLSLYMAYEIVKDDLGGEQGLMRQGWASKAMLKRFTQTAQSCDALGDAARHASRNHPAPAKPMSLEEASALIRELMEKWVATK